MLWTFNYKKGPAPVVGCVEASSEARAYEVMTAWSTKTGVKVFGGLRAFIVADESILPDAGLVPKGQAVASVEIVAPEQVSERPGVFTRVKDALSA